MLTIRYDLRQVCLMARIAAAGPSRALAAAACCTRAELRAASEGREKPSARVLQYFNLERSGHDYIGRFEI
jgi:hypothetical protein